MNKDLKHIELRRYFDAQQFRVERTDEGTYISGRAIPFESYSLPFYEEWVEIISRDALATANMSDVVMVADHARDVRSVLARSKNGEGTLSMSITEEGLMFRFAVPDTSLGNDLVALIERGDICECSFAFYIDQSAWINNGVTLEDKTYDVHRIMSISRLCDLSIVVNGQYGSHTTVGVEERSAIDALRPKPEPLGMSAELAQQIINTL